MNKQAFYKLFFAVFIIAMGCKDRKDQPVPAEPFSLKQDTVKLSVRKVAELRFRRSYATMVDTELTDREWEKIMKAPPTVYHVEDSTSMDVKAMFQKYGFIKGDELLLEKFKYDTASVVELKNRSGNIVKAALQYNNNTTGDFAITVSDTTQTAALKVGYMAGLNGLKFKVLDIIPGGYPEVVLLYEYYIVNGDNFDFLVFEVTK
jgi:hypothetical protein